MDIDNALPFTEKISFGTNEKPDSITMGHYSEIWNWSYYNPGVLDSNLDDTAIRKDMGFSLYYDLDDLSSKNSLTFNYGIVNVKEDANMPGNVTIDTSPAMEHYGEMSVWIQSGTDAGDGMYVTIGEMNADVLGISRLDVRYADGAGEAIELVKGALQKLSLNRSVIGAQQNRLEHIVANEENIVENTTAAESRIRDTDMATAMVEYSNLQILLQAGEAMLAQANQSKQGVLSLLQ